MKKLGVLLLFIMLSSVPVMAETLKVEAITPFNTVKPSKTMKVKITENVVYEKYTLSAGDVVYGDVVDVKPPTRLKRNAKFSFIPVYYVDSSGQKHNFTEQRKGKYALPLDKGQVATKAALTVGNHFVKGISMGYHAVKGAIQDEEDNRLKSAGVSLYENSPLSYVEEGDELNLEPGDKFYIKFGWNLDDSEEDEEESETK